MRGGSLERQGRGAVEGDGRRTVDPARRRRRRQTEEVACLLRLRVTAQVDRIGHVGD
jgi:hypothetical protein